MDREGAAGQRPVKSETDDFPIRTLPFAVNGRFLTQRLTGVQRYAREVLQGFDALLGEDAEVEVRIPPPAAEITPYRRLRIRPAGIGSGYAWEQLSLPFLDGLPLVNLCNLAPVVRTRQIVCIHDANVFNFPTSYSRTFSKFYRTLLPAIAHRSAVLTTVSRASAEDLGKRLSISPGRFEVLPNGHEHVFRWNAANSDIVTRLNLARPYILMIGSAAPHKNMGLILKLAPELHALGLDVVVTGAASGIFAKHDRTEAENVIWTGYVGDDDLAALLKSATCLVFPSLFEGFGLPVVEAMALDCPVVSSNHASLREVCGDAALLAPPDDPAVWLSQIGKLARSEALQADLIERGRERVQAFRWRNTAKGYLNLIGHHFT